MKIIEEFWETRSRKFGNNIAGVLIKSVPEVVNLYLHRWMLRQIEPVIDGGSNLKILDLGCGYGRLSQSLLKKFPKVNTFGVDISKTYVDIYNQNLNPRGKAVVGDILKLPFKMGYFDAAFMVTTLMYVPSAKDQENAIKEIFRVLKPGGNLVIIERSPLGYSIFTLGGITSKIRGKKHSEIPAVSLEPFFLSRLVKKSGGQIQAFEGIPAFTAIFPVILLLSKVNKTAGKIILGIVGQIDKKLRKFYQPSLYIAYNGSKDA